MACPDCVDESNHKVWRRFLDRVVRIVLCAETMETEGVCRRLLLYYSTKNGVCAIWNKKLYLWYAKCLNGVKNGPVWTECFSV